MKKVIMGLEKPAEVKRQEKCGEGWEWGDGAQGRKMRHRMAQRFCVFKKKNPCSGQRLRQKE